MTAHRRDRVTLLSLPSSSFISSLSVTAHSWTSGPPSESRSGEAPGLRPTSLRMSTSGAPASCYLTGAALPPSPRPSCISPQTPAAPAPAPAEPQESHFPWRQHPARDPPHRTCALPSAGSALPAARHLRVSLGLSWVLSEKQSLAKEEPAHVVGP